MTDISTKFCDHKCTSGTTGGAEASRTHNPKLADVIERHASVIEQHNPKLADVIEQHTDTIEQHRKITKGDVYDTHRLRDLANALRSSSSQSADELKIIGNGTDIVNDAPLISDASFFGCFSELKDVSIDARHQLETIHGIISKRSMDNAEQLRILIGDQENGTDNHLLSGYSKFMVLEEVLEGAIEETSGVFQKDLKTMLGAMHTINDIGYEKMPSQDNLEALGDMKSCIERIVKQKDNETPGTEAIIGAACAVQGNTNIQKRLSSLRMETVSNLLSFHEKEELTRIPEAPNLG
ncbi:MAG: hypothetical protein KAJ29_01140 [Alphaproteobacteria bacterium]|nr:hypothetical protein [Alphaproteobacteria bacterium]